MITIKKCSKCNEIKPFDSFGKLSKSKDGYRAQCKECRKQEYIGNAEKIKAKRKVYYKENKEKVLKTSKRYKEEHADWYRQYFKNYYQEHKETIKENVKLYRFNRARTDINFRLIARYRTRVYKALKGIEKAKRTELLIGCTIDELKLHLENQFEEGMNWDNYGEWHVDHIIPCASFDFTNEEHQKECFNYMNLQPLWAMDNLKKSASF